jgi:fermentation-respiration switch protein FrsA (DUF1100 family)
VKALLIGGALVYAGMLLALWLAQDGFIFFPQPSRGSPSAPLGWTIEKVSITAADGTPLVGALVLPARVPGAEGARLPAVLYFGGNAEEVTAYTRDAEQNYGRRAVLFVNYRGYGESGGKPGEKALVADALMVHAWAAKRAELDAARFCVHGRSLGTGVAVQLAAARPVKCVILTSPYDSMVAVGQSHYPFWMPVGWLLKHRFESIAHAPAIKAPLLALYGSDDDIVRASHSERLADAWGGPVERVRFDGFGHNDIDFNPRYAQAIKAFLDRQL